MSMTCSARSASFCNRDQPDRVAVERTRSVAISRTHGRRAVAGARITTREPTPHRTSVQRQDRLHVLEHTEHPKGSAPTPNEVPLAPPSRGAHAVTAAARDELINDAEFERYLELIATRLEHDRVVQVAGASAQERRLCRWPPLPRSRRWSACPTVPLRAHGTRARTPACAGRRRPRLRSGWPPCVT